MASDSLALSRKLFWQEHYRRARRAHEGKNPTVPSSPLRTYSRVLDGLPWELIFKIVTYIEADDPTALALPYKHPYNPWFTMGPREFRGHMSSGWHHVRKLSTGSRATSTTPAPAPKTATSSCVRTPRAPSAGLLCLPPLPELGVRGGGNQTAALRPHRLAAQVVLGRIRRCG
ncbi:uncharacterized protein PG998_007707 [Apiospora kogelbergensis]|uniref:F-box domain-containing protein n=1 Tax=Apiospora kogelbergensis TaxID=1337665 RepID=A0AAW0QSV2_9PEZI